MVFHPPLYPAMLAGGGLFGLDPYAFAESLNAVVFGLTVLIAGWWLRRQLLNQDIVGIRTGQHVLLDGGIRRVREVEFRCG